MRKKKRIQEPEESNGEPQLISSGEEDMSEGKQVNTWQNIHNIALTHKDKDIVGTKHPKVKVYDSLHNKLPWGTKEQIAALLQTEES